MMKKFFTILIGVFAIVAVNAQATVDYALVGYMDAEHNEVTEYNLSMTDDFNPIVVILNNGPDVPAAADTIALDITINGMGLGYMFLLGANIAPLVAGQSSPLASDQPLLTAADLDEAGIEEGTSIEFCMTVRIASQEGTVDPDSENNQACIQVTRGTIGIDENTATQISIYPNPATDVLNVNAAGYNRVEIINMLGQVVYSQAISNNASINVSDLTDGVYFVRLNGVGGTTTQKFIKK